MRKPGYLAALGLCARARRLVSGEEMTAQAIRSGDAKLVLLAADSSENTKKKVLQLCRTWEVPVRVLADRETLGSAIGKEFRSSVAVTDKGFAEMIAKACPVQEKESFSKYHR